MEKTIRRLFYLTLVMIMAFSCTIFATAEDFVDEHALCEAKMAEPGAIYSDIVAGIDLSSVTVDGNATLFSSVMSD